MKKVLLSAVLGLGVASLVGCEERHVYFQGSILPVSEVEERLEDIIEDQNPDFDFEVSIYEESDE